MIFVDTGAWIALSDRKDQCHGDATAIYTRLKRLKERLLTTDYIIDETVTRLRYDLSYSTAIKFLDLVERTEKNRCFNCLQNRRDFISRSKNSFS